MNTKLGTVPFLDLAAFEGPMYQKRSIYQSLFGFERQKKGPGGGDGGAGRGGGGYAAVTVSGPKSPATLPKTTEQLPKMQIYKTFDN